MKNIKSVEKMYSMQVGTMVRLKKPCLDNPVGVKGVVYEDYGGGVSVIFENGRYDGFSCLSSQAFGGLSDIEFILFEDGFCPEVSNYQFENVSCLEKDFRNGVFNSAFSKN